MTCVVSEYTHHLEFYVVVEGRQIKAMIDSGAYANFISKDCVEKQGFETRQKEDPYPVRAYNGLINEDGRVEQETRPLTIRLH